MSEHDATPAEMGPPPLWSVGDANPCDAVMVYCGGVPVAEVLAGPETGPYADRIVNALNSHDELIAALRKTIDIIVYLHERFSPTLAGNYVKEIAAAVLDRAEGR